MTRTLRIAIGTAGALLWLLLLGFVSFASSVMRDLAPSDAKADGIVVLTGGQTRIAEAARLLNMGRAERLLISGVNQKTGRASVLKVSGLKEETFDCCVDLGYAALDTIGNAAETRRWVEALRYKRIIVVTASYHMPRSIAELALVMPGVELIPHPVIPDGLRNTNWWLDQTAMRVLVAEYVKLLPAAAKLAVARGVTPWDATLTASSTAAAPRT